MLKNEIKDMSVTVTSRLNENMFKQKATKSDYKIIADCINDYFKYNNIFNASHIFEVAKFSTAQIFDTKYSNVQILIDSTRRSCKSLKIKFEITNNYQVVCIFYSSGSYYISKKSPISPQAKDILISWGTGIMENLKL